MIEINLLPKEYQKRSFNLSLGKTGLYAVSGAVGILILLFAVTFYQIQKVSDLDKNIQKAKQRAAMLQKDIQVVDALTDIKNKIAARMTAVERLDRHRSAWVRITSDLAQNVPDFVWLAHFEDKPMVDSAAQAANNKKGKPGAPAQPAAQPAMANTSTTPEVRKVTLEGYTFTLNALAKLMINLMRSDYFDEVELASIEEKKLADQKALNFTVTADLHFLSDEELRNMIAQMDNVKTTDDNNSSHKVLN